MGPIFFYFFIGPKMYQKSLNGYFSHRNTFKTHQDPALSDEMPAGVPWGPYLRFFTAALLSAFAGAQTVHIYYKPLEDLDILVKEEMQRREGEQTT